MSEAATAANSDANGAQAGVLGFLSRGWKSATTRRRVLGVVIFLVIAEVLSRTGVLDPRFIPPASVVIIEAFRLCTQAEFLSQIWATIEAWLVGLALSVLVGAAAGYVLGSSKFLYRSTRALFDVIRPVPSVALVPFGILLFQQGFELKIVLIVYTAAWPVLYNVVTAVQQVDWTQRETAMVFGIKRYRRFFQVVVPSTLPNLATGIRIASPIALILAISVGMLGGATKGLGVWILDVSSGTIQTNLVFAGTLIVGLLGALSNVVLAAAERRILPWHPAYRPKGAK